MRGVGSSYDNLKLRFPFLRFDQKKKNYSFMYSTLLLGTLGQWIEKEFY